MDIHTSKQYLTNYSVVSVAISGDITWLALPGLSVLQHRHLLLALLTENEHTLPIK